MITKFPETQAFSSSFKGFSTPGNGHFNSTFSREICSSRDGLSFAKNKRAGKPLKYSPLSYKAYGRSSHGILFSAVGSIPASEKSSRSFNGMLPFPGKGASLDFGRIGSMQTCPIP